MNNSELMEELKKNGDLLTILRCNPGVGKNYILDQIGVSFPTLSRNLDRLKQENILIEDQKVNPDMFWAVGISVGGAQCKITIADACFNAIDRSRFEKICENVCIFNSSFLIDGRKNHQYGYKNFETPSYLLALKENLDEIFKDIIKLHEDTNYPPIIGVGIALTGSIDAEQQIILKSHNVNYLENIKKQELLTPEMLETMQRLGISLVIDHNAKAVATAEKFSLYCGEEAKEEFYNKRNIACVYLGSGMSCGFVLNNTLMRGCRNLNGELGHLQVPRYPGLTDEIDGVCSCGASHCLEHLIVNDVFGMTKEEFKSATSDSLKEFLDTMEREGKKEEVLKRLGYYVGWVIDLLIKLLNVGLVVFSGKTTSFINDVWKYVTLSIGQINDAKLDCSVKVSTYGALAPAVGAAILATYGENASVRWPVLPA